MRTFRILYTSDIHGRLFGHRGEPGLDVIGAQFRKDGNTLILDGGDLLQGGAEGAFFAQRKERPHPAAALLNGLGYDAVTVGNHDLNYGLDYLEGYLEDLQASCLCANLRDRAGRLPITDSRIFRLVNGLRIGVVGLCTSAIPGWERAETVAALSIEPALSAARRALEALRGQCDVTVCLYHGGFEADLETGTVYETTGENEGCRLCRALDFDLLLTGHQHIWEPGRLVGGTYVLQPGCFGQSYGEIEGVVPDEGPVRFTSRLRPAPVPEAEPAETPERAAIRRWKEELLCTLPEPLPVGDRVEMALHGSALADRINEIQMEVTGAEISATCLSSTAVGLPAAVRVDDVFRTYTSANTLCTVRCSGVDLRRALEWTAEFLTWTGTGYQVDPRFRTPKLRLFHYDFYAGIDYKLDFRKPAGHRVVRLNFRGKEIRPEDSFVLCITNYRKAGGDGYDMFRSCELLSADPTPVAEHMIRYFRRLGQQTDKTNLK